MTGRIKKDFRAFWDNVKKVNRLSHKYNKLVLLSTLISLVLSGLSLLSPILLSNAINIIFDGINFAKSFNSIDVNSLLTTCILYGVVVLATAAISIGKNLLDVHIKQDFTKALRRRIATKVAYCKINYILKGSKGDYISRIINDVDVVGKQFSTIFSTFFNSIVSLVVSLIIMFSLNWFLTIVVLCIVPLSSLASSIMVKISQKYIIKNNKYLGKVNGYVEEQLNGIDYIHIFNKDSASLKAFEKLNSDMYKNSFKGRIISSVLSPLVLIVNKLVYILIVVLGAIFTIYGYFTVGGIQLFIQYMDNFSNPVYNLTNLVNGMQNLAACTDRVLEFLNYPDEGDIALTNKLIICDKDNMKNKPIVNFDNVTFAYDTKPVLQKLSFRVDKGETVAIVGPTGSGKTTITKLLLKYYDINEGSIKLYGQDIKDISANELRSSISYVLQDIWVPKGSIKQAITYDDENVDEEKFKLACKMSCCDQFISMLENGYEYIVDMDSKNLSAGQLQLITIARALYFGYEIFVFDEATSNVDTKTEKLIYEAFDNLAKNHTCIIVAHRLSTILKADKILVLNNGAIVEQGTHNELMNKHGFYYEIFSTQFKRDE